MRINTNIPALRAHRNMSRTGLDISRSVERLSSGLRINRAGDDAAGLVISQKLRAEASGLRQSMRNAQDGISFVQTAEGALDEVSSMMNRQRDLVLQARNGMQDADSKAAIQAEFDALTSEINRISSSTEFAGKTVFDAAADVKIQVGNSDSDQIAIDNTNGLDVFTQAAVADISADGVLATLDGQIDDVSTARGSLGAIQNRLESSVRSMTVTAENLTAAESRIRDVDVAAEMMAFTRASILQQAGTAMLAQSNGLSQSALMLLG